jgi:hypothetical protein
MCADRPVADDAGMVTNDTTSSHPVAPPAGRLRRWMQVVGAFYVAQFVAMAIVRAPIRTFGPTGTLDKADSGDVLAKFVIDTWTTFALEVLAVGVVLLIASRRGDLARGAIYTVLAIEISRGLIADSYMIARGVYVGGYLVWIAIHSTVLITGILALRAARREASRQPHVATATVA